MFNQIKFLTLVFLFTSCQSEKLSFIEKYKIEVSNFECWLNLMPGGKPTFHYTGKIKYDNKKCNSVSLVKVEIFTNENLVNSSTPQIISVNEPNKSEFNYSIIEFTSPTNVRANDQILKADFVDVKFYLSICDNKVELIKKRYNLQRVY
ncbi:MAG: hypothetical protein NZM09_09155 [Ignavibacterium sp.]|nr:hypothetical protein [Ignavibacterium sp.]MDW8375850.1 hypothetical protein [Ignavibacteriales bacterium]